MPEATPVPTPPELDAFTRAYLECAAWSSTEGENGEIQIDDVMNAGKATWAPETIRKAVEDCYRFQVEHADLLARAGDPAQNGHDFWLTRCHHGTGFWDRGYPTNVGKPLTEAAHACGECWLTIGDDGLVYMN